MCKFKTLVALLCLGMAVSACGQVSDHIDMSDFDEDSDSSTDSETDFDTIFGTDTDSEVVNECPWNSGWPCACDNPGGSCDDGFFCLGLPGADTGICSYNSPSRTSVGSNVICEDVDFDAYPTGLWNKQFDVDPSNAFYCALECSGDSECPQDQVCTEIPTDDGVHHFCYPHG